MPYLDNVVFVHGLLYLGSLVEKRLWCLRGSVGQGRSTEYFLVSAGLTFSMLNPGNSTTDVDT